MTPNIVVDPLHFNIDNQCILRYHSWISFLVRIPAVPRTLDQPVIKLKGTSVII